MEWGFNPDTLVAIATSLAAVAAVWAGFYAVSSFKQLRLQVEEGRKQSQSLQAQLDREIEREHRHQAESIQVWTEVFSVTDEGSEEAVSHLKLHALNSSSAPIFNLYVGLDLGKKDNPDIWYSCNHHILAARGSETEPLTLTISNPTYADWQAWEKRHPKNKHPRVEIQFTDARGSRWVRNSDGKLLQLDDTELETPPWVRKRLQGP